MINCTAMSRVNVVKINSLVNCLMCRMDVRRSSNLCSVQSGLLSRLNPVNLITINTQLRQLRTSTSHHLFNRTDPEDKQRVKRSKPEDIKRTPAGDPLIVKDIVVAKQLFEGEEKDRESFIMKCEEFTKTMTKHRSGHAEFIYGAMKVMKEFGVHKDLEAYKALMDVFPKERMKPTNFFQAASWHYNKQQQCAIQLLEKMEYYQVMPDQEMEQLVIAIFSKHSYVWRKVARQLYWMSKFRNASPFPLPEQLPDDALELAKIALKRMCPDLQTKIGVSSTGQVSDAIDKTWIVSAQSPSQKELVNELSEGTAVYIDGPFRVYVADKQISYFLLRTDTPSEKLQTDSLEDPLDVSNISMDMFGKPANAALMEQKNVHVQKDGTILALCATGTSSRDSVLSWVRLMEQTNPNLKNMQVIFTTKAPETQLATINDPSKAGMSDYEKSLGEFKRVEENDL